MLTLRKDATSTQLLDYNSEGKKTIGVNCIHPI